MSDLDSHLIPAFDPPARGRDGRQSQLILFVEKMWGKKTNRLDSRQDGALLRRYSVQRRRGSNDLARAASLI